MLQGRVKEGHSPLMIGIYIYITERKNLTRSLRGVPAPLHKIFPLSFEGEGERGGEVDRHKV
jgi:hypothetical protein